MKKQPKIKNLLNDTKSRSRKKKIITSVMLIVLLLPIVSLSIAAAGFAIWADGVSVDKNLLPTASAKPTFFDVNGYKIEYLTDDYVMSEQIPNDLKNAFIALEDKRFYSHKGYDIVRIGGALVSNIKSKSIKEGASTITQQLVKNTHLSNERTVERKLKEIAIARKIEKEYSKDEILAMYLSVIYFGNGAYGVKQASRLYFDKELDELTLEECATLAGIVKNPKKYSPFSDKNDCINRRNLVLSVMNKEGYISSDSMQKAANYPLNSVESGKKGKRADYCDYYLKKASDEVCSALGITKYQLNNSGLKIYTNLDVSMQKALYDNANDSSLFDTNDVQSVQIVVDNRINAVVACYSSLGYDANRQAGSVMKPIAVYAPAIDMNLISLATPVVDEKIDFGGYSPSNFSDKYYGNTSIREAIKKSMNSVAVKTISYVGLDKSAQYISNFGVNLEYSDQNYALALGATAKGVSPIEICDAYSVFANNGVYKQNSFVKYVVAGDNKNYISSRENASRFVIKPSTASIISSALIDTAKDGTARTLCTLPFEVAAKTGTAERQDGKNSDAWCVSYNDNFTVCVWHGSDAGTNEKGGGYPAMNNKKIWQSINSITPQPQTISICADTEWKDVDTYATKKYKQVMLASDNTPIEYRKSEIFVSNTNLKTSDCFDVIEDFDFSIIAKANRVQIDIESSDIYSYKVYRRDFYGKTLINDFVGDGENIRIYDTPLAFFDVVEYTIECYITFNEDIKKSSTKLVYVDDLIDENSIEDYINQ